MRVSAIYSSATFLKDEIIGNFIQQALSGKIEIFGNGNRIYDFIHVSDVAYVAIKLIGKKLNNRLVNKIALKPKIFLQSEKSLANIFFLSNWTC